MRIYFLELSILNVYSVCMKKRVNISLDLKIHAVGVALAKEEGTDFSGWITNAIVTAKRKRGASGQRIKSPEPVPTASPLAEPAPAPKFESPDDLFYPPELSPPLGKSQVS